MRIPLTLTLFINLHCLQYAPVQEKISFTGDLLNIPFSTNNKYFAFNLPASALDIIFRVSILPIISII